MTDIHYRQEKINPVIYIVPAALIAGGIWFMVSRIMEIRAGEVSSVMLLIPLLPLAFGVGILIFGLKTAKKQQQEIREIREKGRELTGEILDIEEHVSYSSDGDGGSSKEYSYTFIVRYADPDTAQPVTAESIETHRHYVLQQPACQIRVYNGKVLVEKACVEVKKNKSFIAVILFFLVGGLVFVGRWKGWF